MRHWPWVAVAAKQYAFERQERARYADEPQPRDIERLITKIESGARELANDLTWLYELGNRLGELQAPDRRDHIAYLGEFIAQNLLTLRPHLDERPEASLKAFSALQALCRQLVTIEIAAKESKYLINKELLRLTRGQADAGLGMLVWRCATVWKSLTGKKASAYKTAEKPPPFARFVTNVAQMAAKQTPSTDAIATALRALN